MARRASLTPDERRARLKRASGESVIEPTELLGAPADIDSEVLNEFLTATVSSIRLAYASLLKGLQENNINKDSWSRYPKELRELFERLAKSTDK